ncbi:hypothetical protein [Paenibacillus campi]|uniref:hypothetical protein n=1 Tax=Paenibacillus campi TaxID=3106031 RepID=UPI002AFF8C5C|nr:hypothetical protein [Paenibacillus sp. SGZ-1014]
MTKKYLVTNPFVDRMTNKVILPGAEYEAGDERAKRLQAADVIGAEIEPAKVEEAPTTKTGKNAKAADSDEKKEADANVDTTEQG